jgi:hypothetical protein
MMGCKLLVRPFFMVDQARRPMEDLLHLPVHSAATTAQG